MISTFPFKSASFSIVVTSRTSNAIVVSFSMLVCFRTSLPFTFSNGSFLHNFLVQLFVLSVDALLPLHLKGDHIYALKYKRNKWKQSLSFE